MKYSKTQLINILKSVGKDHVSKKDIDKNPTIDCGSMTIIRYFGSWKNALEEAGLKPGKITGRKRKIIVKSKIVKPNLMDRKKLWVGPIDFPKTDNIKNDPKTTYANDIIIWKGHELTRKYLRSIDEDVRDEIAKDLLNFFMEFDFIGDFKYREEELETAKKVLDKNLATISEEDGVKYVKNTGAAGYKLYRHYFPNLMKVGGKNRRSIFESLSNKALLWSIIRNRTGNTLLYGGEYNKDIGYCQFPMPLSFSQIIIGSKNSGLGAMGSVFKPSVAKAIYCKYAKDGDKVLDYSCGFGTRLLGLMSSGLKDVKYCGYEPNTETYDNLNKLIEDFDFDADIKCCGSEEDNLFDEKFDFVFSSPPYFDAEVYCDEENQSINRFPKYESWLEGYWKQTVKNIKKMMKDDGVFGINIGGNANETMIKLERDLNKIISEEGFELIDTIYMKTGKSHLSGKKGDPDKKFKLEGIFFYKRSIRNGSE